MPEFDVVSLGETDHPGPGDEAPEFTRPLVTDEFWEDRTLSAVTQAADGPTLLVFTPMVGSFAATYVFEELHERGWHERAGRVVGVTVSTPYAIKRFLAENDLPFAFFSDPGNDVAEAYDLVHDLDGMTGVTEARPAIFALEADRTVVDAWVATEWPEFPPYDDIEERFGLE